MKFLKYFDKSMDSNDVEFFANHYGISPKVMKIIYNRGYNTEEKISKFLSPEIHPIQSPLDLNGMTEAVEKIKGCILNHKNILVFGDYDVDGISATAIILKTLEKLGCSANYFLPNRYVDGYGLSVEVIDKVKKLYNPDLIITVDCGITAYKEVEYAKSIGIDVIVTDHHEIGEMLPDCITINTKFTNQKYEFRGLCGTGVAYMLALALLGEENCKEFLPIVAIATIADIVPLTDDNRTLVRLGFKNMGLLPPGIKQMFTSNKISLAKFDASDIAFKIAPKLNASGRMGDAGDSLRLYLEKDPVIIKQLIQKIHEHNQKRQQLGNVVYEDCKTMLKGKEIYNMPAIILWKEDWDHGILGIECSKLLEEYNRPVFLFTKEGDYLKGSARSIKDVNIHHILTSVSDILEVFGGHTMAAGLSLKITNFDEFVKRVNSYIYENINFDAFQPIEYYDDEIKLGDINPKLIEDLKLLEPCGAENSKPRFLIETDKITVQPISKNSPHANIIIGKNLNLIYFNYTKDSHKLNFGESFNFIFEFQNIKSKFYKGVIKHFDFNNKVKQSSKKYLECFNINQIDKTKYSQPVFQIYNQEDILKFVMDCSKAIFGTVFVAFNVDTYNNFIKNYDMSNIYCLDVCKYSQSGFNSVVLCPKDESFAENYSKIIFLDNVIDNSFISKINTVSKAKIYLPKAKNSLSTLLNNLRLDRKHFSQVYNLLLQHQNYQFISLLSVYSAMYRSSNISINFNNFIVPFYVFKQLNIIEVTEDAGIFSYNMNTDLKTDLTNSTIYNTLCLLKKIK